MYAYQTIVSNNWQSPLLYIQHVSEAKVLVRSSFGELIIIDQIHQ